MKNHKCKKYAAVLFSLALGTTFTSCTDWLTLYPKDKIVEENFWEDKRDLISVRNAAYANMTSEACMERYMVWGELRADNFKENTSVPQNLQEILDVNLKPTNPYYDWSSFYATINYCNKVLQHGPETLKKDNSFSESEWQGLRAEMITLRALNYFYLLRTFGDVPMVFNAINDDNEVQPLAPTPQEELLTHLINQLEEVIEINQMTSKFGSAADNKGFITDKAVYTVLADLYLWRGSYYAGKEETRAKATADYTACATHCKKVMDLFDEDFRKLQNSGNVGIFGTSEKSKQLNKYHLIWNEGIEGIGLELSAYDEIFGRGNCFESIFELQFNGDASKNNLVPNYYMSSNGPATLVPVRTFGSALSAKSNLASSSSYGKTDLRMWSTLVNHQEQQLGILKYAAASVDQPSLNTNQDLTDEREKPKSELRTKNDAHWIFYRLPDVLLMRAEALALIGGKENCIEAFNLVNAVYTRSNSQATGAEAANWELKISDFGNGDNAQTIQNLVMYERNREFFGEGKRWFDLVRYALRFGEVNGPNKAFEVFGHKFEGKIEKTAQTKYKQGFDVMYAPYTETEVKANPLLKEYQNPIWDTENSIQKK